MDDFLTKNKGSHEPGIIIALDKAHARKVEQYLLSKGFETNENLDDLIQEFRVGGNVYVSSEKIENPASLFDIVMGFSSGSIQLNDIFISPKYDQTNFILNLSRDFLDSETEQGRNWLSVGGLTIQAD